MFWKFSLLTITPSDVTDKIWHIEVVYSVYE